MTDNWEKPPVSKERKATRMDGPDGFSIVAERRLGRGNHLGGVKRARHPARLVC